MTKQEVLKKLLIKPKKLVLSEGEYSHDRNYPVYTNADTNMNYLLSLADFSNTPETVWYDTDQYVLSIGETEPEIPEYEFNDDEEYVLNINQNSILIVGKTIEGMLLGLKAFIRMSSELETMPQMNIRDYPNIHFRAVHTCMFKPNDGTDKEESNPEYIKKMMTTAALCGYNHIFIEFWGMFPYSLPYAHWPNAYSIEEIKDLVDFAFDKVHIRPLPQQNLTSHAAWSRLISRQHCVLDQRPDMADMYIAGGWCFATENPKTQEFLKLVMDELIAVFRNPPYFHTGCDKAFGFGSTEEDRRMSADVLLAKHLSSLNSYLSVRNIKMVMWGDMLYCSMDALYWKCREEIVDMLPKNILINVWTHDNPSKNWQDPGFFEKKGFETIYSPFLNEVGAESMIEICKERRSHGILQTTWHKPQTAVPTVVFSGALMWCGKKPADELKTNFAEKWYR